MQPDVHVVLGDVEVEVAALLGVGVEQLLGVRLRGRENGFEYVTLLIRKLSVVFCSLPREISEKRVLRTFGQFYAAVLFELGLRRTLQSVAVKIGFKISPKQATNGPGPSALPPG